MSRVVFERELYVPSHFPSIRHFSPLRRQRMSSGYLKASRLTLQSLMSALIEFRHLTLPMIGHFPKRSSTSDFTILPIRIRSRSSPENYFKPLRPSPLTR
ncbi:hypothetical protein DFH28DRAFT_1125176 [Melampsora americana]|nr:hypothetical protein DFH28DRAFT_1125176 [Melampsora americana]